MARAANLHHGLTSARKSATHFCAIKLIDLSTRAVWRRSSPSTEMDSRAEHPVVGFGADRALSFSPVGSWWARSTCGKSFGASIDSYVRGPGPASQFLISTKKLGENPALSF